MSLIRVQSFPDLIQQFPRTCCLGRSGAWFVNHARRHKYEHFVVRLDGLIMPEKSPNQWDVPEQWKLVLDCAVLLKQDAAEQKRLTVLHDHIGRGLHRAPYGLVIYKI